MTKIEFVLELNEKLSGLPQDDLHERLEFYSEMIDDRIEEGLSEEEAVRDIGSTDEIVAQILAETPLVKIVKDKIKPKRKIGAWEIVLLVLGSPIWLSLLIAGISVFLSLYVVAWALIVSLWSIFAAFVACAFAGVAAGIVFSIFESALTGIAMISTGVVCAGLSIFTFFGCKEATGGISRLTKNIVLAIKKRFIKKEEK